MTPVFADKVHNSKSFQQNGLRPYIEKLATYKDDGQLQVVHTPFWLCEDILRKVSEFRNLKNSNMLVLFNLEFLDVLLDSIGTKPSKITFAADAETKLEAAKAMGCNTLNVTCSKKRGVEIMLEPKKKFDVIVMNPPYQSGNGNKGRGNILWDKFVRFGNNIVNKNGHMAFVHPSLWRKPGHLLQQIIMSNQIEYLEIHDEKDGLKTFGAETRYDWYVATKTDPVNSSIIVDQNGKKRQVRLSDMPFIPNCQFDEVIKLLPQNGEPCVEIINDRSAYGADKIWVSDEKKDKFKYPCVYMVHKDNSLSLKWSRRKSNGHFGIPKLIYSSGRPVSVGFFVDKNGEYGLTQWASGIVDKPSILPKIARALNSDKFRQFCSSISMSKLEVNTSVLRCFRKDFWKEFIQ